MPIAGLRSARSLPVFAAFATIQRGVHWVELGVPYSTYHATESYRQDCSGSVSMEWELTLFVLEETAPGELMQIRTMTRADAASRYAPIRKNGL